MVQYVYSQEPLTTTEVQRVRYLLRFSKHPYRSIMNLCDRCVGADKKGIHFDTKRGRLKTPIEYEVQA